MGRRTLPIGSIDLNYLSNLVKSNWKNTRPKTNEQKQCLISNYQNWNIINRFNNTLAFTSVLYKNFHKWQVNRRKKELATINENDLVTPVEN